MSAQNNLPSIDKVIEYSSGKKQYVLKNNKQHLLNWTITFCIIALLFFGLIVVPLFFLNYYVGLITLIIPVLLIFMGIRFYYLSTVENAIVIDLQQKVLIYSKTLVIPFKTIKHLSQKKVMLYEPSLKSVYRLKRTPSFQVFLEDHRGNKANLFRADSPQNALKIMQTLAPSMNIVVKK